MLSQLEARKWRRRAEVFDRSIGYFNPTYRNRVRAEQRLAQVGQRRSCFGVLSPSPAQFATTAPASSRKAVGSLVTIGTADATRALSGRCARSAFHCRQPAATSPPASCSMRAANASACLMTNRVLHQHQRLRGDGRHVAQLAVRFHLPARRTPPAMRQGWLRRTWT